VSVCLLSKLPSMEIFLKLEFSRQILEKYSNIIFHENPTVETELLHADRQRNVTKLVVAFRNFANVPKTDAVCDFCPCSDVSDLASALQRADIQGVPGGMDKTSGECSLC